MRAKVMETRIVEELREITGNPRLESRDVMEWNASRSAVRLSVKPDEVMIECPKSGVWAAVRNCAAAPAETPDMFHGGLVDGAR